MIPILTQLVNIWYKAGVFPPTFLQADIFCLKKSGDLSNPLNYRPFALLNSDYKIITRILATRVSKTLLSRIHSHQKGFVPGRQIHDTIDLFMAAQQMANLDDEQREALALLLDFQKPTIRLDVDTSSVHRRRMAIQPNSSVPSTAYTRAHRYAFWSMVLGRGGCQ